MRKFAQIALMALPIMAACAGTETPTVPNNPPSVAFAFDEVGFARGAPVSLSVIARDADEGDQVTITWSFTAGTWTPENSSRTSVEWVPPSSVGEATVTVTASDGKNSVSIRQVLKVCTLASEVNARNLYQAVESPYLILPTAAPGVLVDLNVDGNVAIEPGVEFLIGASSTQILIRGTLQVNGTAVAPVRIRPNLRNLSCPGGRGSWVGMKVTDNGSVFMTHTTVEFALNNLIVSGNANATLFKCVLNCGENAGVNMESGRGILDIDSCQVVDHTSYGVTVSATTLLPTSISITNTDVMFNGGTGIDISVPDVAAAVPMIFDHVLVYRNLFSGMRFTKSANPTISDCHFEGNGSGGTANIVLGSGFPGGAPVDTIRATNCYWGAPFVFQSSIDGTIVDELDSAAISTRVWVAPWSNISPTGLPN